MLVTIVDQFKY